MSSQVNISNLESAFDPIIPAGFQYAVCSEVDDHEVMKPDSDYLLSVTNKKRNTEFRLGRQSARQALGKIREDLKSAELKRAPSGSVEWPDGICGSISHSGNFAAAIAGETGLIKSVGLDFEIYRDLKSGVENKVASDAELKIARDITGDPKLAFFMLFCSKEAIFKCLSPLGYNSLFFCDASLRGASKFAEKSLELDFDFSRLSEKTGLELNLTLLSAINPLFSMVLCLASTAPLTGQAW